MNLEKVPHEEVLPLLMNAGEDIYSYEFVDIEIPDKKKKNVVVCKLCHESFVSKDNRNICIPCTNKKV
jgi:formylmethanofuran dehydrogenase subunit E